MNDNIAERLLARVDDIVGAIYKVLVILTIGVVVLAVGLLAIVLAL